jgi:putative oxidoreductase
VAAFVASGSMAYAYFHVHFPHGWLPIENHGEPAAMFCWAFFLLVFTGSGAFALERAFSWRRGPRPE